MSVFLTEERVKQFTGCQLEFTTKSGEIRFIQPLRMFLGEGRLFIHAMCIVRRDGAQLLTTQESFTLSSCLEYATADDEQFCMVDSEDRMLKVFKPGVKVFDPDNVQLPAVSIR